MSLQRHGSLITMGEEFMNGGTLVGAGDAPNFKKKGLGE
jgi:hypothetical protein